MLKLKPPNYKHCPFCGEKLKIKVEEEIERKFCNDCNWTFYPHVSGAVAAIIINQEEVLMVQRKREPYVGTWMFPAGFIDYGEHPEETLEREIKEETGLGLRRAKLIDVIQTEDDPRSPGHFCFFYKVEVRGNKPETDRDENSDIGWFKIGNMPKIGWLSHKKMASRIKKDESKRN